MENFTPWSSLLGGLLIGGASFALLFFNGRIAGISGITGGLLTPKANDVAWRVAFVGGLLAGGVLMGFLRPDLFTYTVPYRSAVMVSVAGLLVGFGTRLGSGCTSGHGVCGISRLSPRSVVATVTFMATGAAAVFFANSVGGAS